MDSTIKAVRSGKNFYFISSTGYHVWRINERNVDLMKDYGTNWDALIKFADDYFKRHNYRIVGI